MNEKTKMLKGELYNPQSEILVKERLAAKHTPIQRYFNDVNEAYKRPTPITLSLSVSIVTKLITDLYQIYGKFCSQFQPYQVISWKVPKNVGINHDEELRNKLKLKSLILTSFLVGNEPEVYIVIVGLFLKKRASFTLCLKFSMFCSFIIHKIG